LGLALRDRYDTHVPAAAFMILVGLVFSTVGPMLLPFLVLYFVIGRVVWTHQLTQVQVKCGRANQPSWVLETRHGRVWGYHQLSQRTDSHSTLTAQVYAPGVGKDSRGLIWMHMVDKVFVSLVVFQVILIGIFLLKGASLSTGAAGNRTHSASYCQLQ
jgi:hypothetical protein